VKIRQNGSPDAVNTVEAFVQTISKNYLGQPQLPRYHLSLPSSIKYHWMMIDDDDDDDNNWNDIINK
jgi:hypothetical protein